MSVNRQGSSFARAGRNAAHGHAEGPDPRIEPSFAEASTVRHSRPCWREFAIEVLYPAGAVRLMERMARSLELKSTRGGKWEQMRRGSAPRFGILCYHRVCNAGVALCS